MKNIAVKFHDYLPVRDRELDWGLYVTVVGFNRVLPGEVFPSPKHHPMSYQFDLEVGRYLPEYQLTFITEGQGEFHSQETGTVALTKGTTFLLFPNVWHTYRPDPQTGWEDYWIGFNGSYAYELSRRNILSPHRTICHPSQPEKLVGIFEEILEAVQAEPATNSFLYSAKVLEILACVLEENEPQHDAELLGKEKIVEDALQMIWGWSYRVLGVNDIARHLGIQRRTLERYFREVRDVSILEEIICCRLNRACRLLENTRIPIGRIALMSGFTTVQQMRHNFKSYLGKTPEQFRRFTK